MDADADVEKGHTNGYNPSEGGHSRPGKSMSKALSKAFLSAGMVVSVKVGQVVHNACPRRPPCGAAS